MVRLTSVKRLRFIESPIYEIKDNSYTISKTSSPIGVIYGFNSATMNFDTFQSWITAVNSSKFEIFDLCYILNSSFFYTLLDLDHKDKITKGIYLFENAVRKMNSGYKNIDNYEQYQDDIRYPQVSFDGNNRIVDPAIGFINFLSNIYDMLSLKRITESSILRDYLSDKMLYEGTETSFQ